MALVALPGGWLRSPHALHCFPLPPQYQIESVTLHPDYDPDSFAHDIAVVTIRGAPSRRELRRLGVFPITLNKSTKRPRNREPVTLTGWGASSGKTGEVKVTPELAVTLMKVNPYNRCVKYLTRRKIDTFGLDKDIMICASLRDTTSSCSGDSGGTCGGGAARGCCGHSCGELWACRWWGYWTVTLPWGWGGYTGVSGRSASAVIGSLVVGTPANLRADLALSPSLCGFSAASDRT